ncbi:MAG: transglycosylase SLT domain-containing protein [Tepidiformaceae bacterium]
MAIDASAHVSLIEAGKLARGLALTAAGTGAAPATAFRLPTAASASSNSGSSQRISTGASGTFAPHTAVQSSTSADPNQWDAMLNKLGAKYNVPPLFLKSVMLSESGGQPDAVGDQGHSVGLFQLNDNGYGAGMGDSRYDPATNADRAAQGLAEAWHAGQNAGYTGEYAVRAAYDYSFNPGGGWAYQGDSVVRNYDQLLANQGQPPLS